MGTFENFPLIFVSKECRFRQQFGFMMPKKVIERSKLSNFETDLHGSPEKYISGKMISLIRKEIYINV